MPMARKKTAKKNNERSGSLVLVSVSALALSSMPLGKANAQNINIACATDIDIGQNVACGTGNIIIRPDGGILQNGCIVSVSPPSRARCQMSVTGAAPTRSVVVDMDPTPIAAIAGGTQVTLDTFRLQKDGQIGSANQLTYTTAELTAAVTINVGATMRFTDQQPKGVYVGNIGINANFN